MREIKFRAWDKEEKIMKEVKSLEWPLGDGMRCEARDWYDDYDERWVWGKVGERYEVMEFTGLKDKNGKEIYEGDIIKYINIYGLEMITEINWNEDELSFDVPEFMETCEVVGNIYENLTQASH